MSRRRSISTDISTDPKLAAIAEEYGTLPLLLYTWAIPHATDFGQITSNPTQFRLLVCPALPIKSAEVTCAIQQLVAAGLWRREGEEGHEYLQFPEDEWSKAHNIAGKERRKDWKKICKKMRQIILVRDGRDCRECGRDYFPEIDHIFPILHGGTNDPENLQVLCRPCNRKKWAHKPGSVK